MNWLYNNWYKFTAPLALLISIPLFTKTYHEDFPLFLIWLQTVVYLIHQFEEYILPGGFVKFFNHNLLDSQYDDQPLNKVASFWINIPIIFVAFPISAYLAGAIDLSFGVWTAYFSIINAASHVGMSFKYKYNPGLVVSALLNIPFGIYTLYYFTTNQLVSTQVHLFGLLIGLAIQASLMIYGFKILKKRASVINH